MAYSRTNWRENETPLSAQNMNNIEDGIEEALVNAKGNQDLWTFIRNLVYPVGSIYMSTDSTNPSARFGGTWVAWGSGKVPVGVNTSDTSFNTVEKTGGTKDSVVVTHNHTATFSGNAVGNHTHTGPSHTHTGPSHTHTMAHTHTGPSHSHTPSDSANYFLTIPKSGDKPVSRKNFSFYESPAVTKLASSHQHGIDLRQKTISGYLYTEGSVTRLSNTSAAGTGNTGAASNSTTSAAGTGATGAAGTGNTSAAGGHTPSGSVSVANNGVSGTDKNLQPYITCYMWKRTA